MPSLPGLHADRDGRPVADLRKGGGLRRRLHAMNQAADAAFQAFADDVEESAISAAVLEEEAQHSAAAAFEQAEASRAADEAQFAERKKREATDEVGGSASLNGLGLNSPPPFPSSPLIANRRGPAQFDAWLRTEVGKTALRGAIEVQEARMLAAGPTGDATGAGALLTRDQHQHAVSLAKVRLPPRCQGHSLLCVTPPVPRRKCWAGGWRRCTKRPCASSRRSIGASSRGRRRRLLRETGLG